MDWLNTIIRTFFDFKAMAEVLPQLLGVGLLNTLIISVSATVIGVVLGMIVAVMGISPSKWLRLPARIYTDLFRGLPAILTILLIGQGFAKLSQSIFGPSPYPLFIAIVKDSSLVYFLGLLVSERELFRVGQDAAVLSGNLSPLVMAGIFYLVITVPLTHLVNYFDNRFRTGRRRPTAPSSGLNEVQELSAVSPLTTGSNT
jgi:polar amino acid transport system permease protein